MKILNRAQFLAQPPGTVYAKTVGTDMQGLCIKLETYPGGDWVFQDLIAIDATDSGEYFARFAAMEHDGAEFPWDSGATMRDGLFDADDKFLVFDAADLDGLIAALQAARDAA